MTLRLESLNAFEKCLDFMSIRVHPMKCDCSSSNLKYLLKILYVLLDYY